MAKLGFFCWQCDKIQASSVEPPTFDQEVLSAMKLINNSNKSATKAELQYSDVHRSLNLRKIGKSSKRSSGNFQSIEMWVEVAGCVSDDSFVQCSSSGPCGIAFLWELGILCSIVEFIWNCVKGRARDIRRNHYYPAAFFICLTVSDCASTFFDGDLGLCWLTWRIISLAFHVPRNVS